MKMQFFISSQKGVTALVVFIMIAVFEQWQNTTAWVYLALHGTYGFLWVFKSLIFPDRKFEQQISLGFGLVIWASLSLYWITPFVLTSQGVQVPGWYMALCISIFGFGVFFHFVTDMQKYISLQLQPGQLITGGMMSRVRNMNYFGELLIYLAFALLAVHWLPLIVLLIWIFFYWLPNMRIKDHSLSRYADFSAYKKRTKLFIPYIY